MQHSILVIDDDADIRNALQLMLKKAGYCPILADGGQADEVIQQRVGDWIRKPATNEAVLEKVRGAVHLFELRKAECGFKERQRSN